MRYFSGSWIDGPQGEHKSRVITDSLGGGSQIGVAFVYGVMPMGHWYWIVLRSTDRPEIVPGRFRLADGELTLIPGSEAE